MSMGYSIIADVFDELLSKRVYKQAYYFDECISIINKESGYHFQKE